jgi:hypothetical protein
LQGVRYLHNAIIASRTDSEGPMGMWNWQFVKRWWQAR